MRELTVQRRDVWAAIAILKSSGIRFRRAASG
jgi:biotin operon repressor